MTISRRSFLGTAGAIAAGAVVPFSMLYSRSAHAASGYGPLIADPSGMLDLPAGFSYRVLERAGDRMTDGYAVPGAPDGMACFAGPRDTLVLLRNHELRANVANGPYPVGQAPPEAYDAAAMGGVTRLVLDRRTLTRVSSNLVLTGTIRNCAGGPTPWGWLSCEETTEAGHGWVFLCDPNADRVRPPKKIPGYGRYNHEAAAIDPDTLICYLTEDAGQSCLYRFVPARRSNPFEGQLQALRVVGRNAFDTSNMSVGQSVELDWVDVDADPAGSSPGAEARAQGAATIVRGEGIWYFDNAIYICSTSGGPVAGGQIFKLVPEREGRRATLSLLAQSTDRARLDMPDNITVAPWGAVFLAEDGDGDQYLRVLEVDGTIADFARNAVSDGELAGVCFSPDGATLFVNLQSDGVTLAITGPFRSGGAPDGGASTGGTSGGQGPGPLPLPDCSTSGTAPRASGVIAFGAAALVGAAVLARRGVKPSEGEGEG